MNDKVLTDLQSKTKIIRENILETIGIDKKGHLGGSMSLAEIIAVLYFQKMKHSAKKPDDPDRDRCILSKGHAVLAQYAALAECGYFARSELKNTKSLGSILQGHPERETPGIEANTGSLGQGLSIGIGLALGAKLDKKDFNIYIILGDGELAEGQVWEAVNTAWFYELDNIKAIVDCNKLSSTGTIKDLYDLGDIKRKFDAFGWRTFEIDGHDFEEIIEALEIADEVVGVPSVILAHTIKCKGVSFAEGNASFHNNSLTESQYNLAKQDIISCE
jgi:transketolase